MALLCEKGLAFKQKLGEKFAFQQVRGCASLNGVRELDIHGNKMSADAPSATLFIKKLVNIIKDCKYNLELMYNMNKSDLFWKSITLSSKHKKSAPS